MKKKLMMLLLLAATMVPATAQEELSHILIYKVDGTVDSLLLNNVRDVYHSRTDVNGVEQSDISTLRLRTIGSEVVYPLTEIDHVVMPKTGRFISFMGTADQYENTAPNANNSPAHAPWRTSVTGDFQAVEGTPFRYNWVSSDYIWLSTGEKSYNVSLSSSSTASNGRFSFHKDLLEDQYDIYYSGTKSGIKDQVIIPVKQQQNGSNNSDHLGASGDCGTATATRMANSNYSFALDHKTPILCFMPRVDSLNTIQLEHVALKADRTIAGTYTLSPEGVTLLSGASDTITLTTKNFLLPQLKANAQDSAASYIVVAPQTEKTTFKLYYKVRDTRSDVDTVIVKNVWWDKLEPAKLYPVNSKIPVRSFLMAYTDSCKWDFGEKATLYGALNLPVEDFGFWWGYNKNLTNETKAAEISMTKPQLSAYPEYKFSHDAVDDVKQKAYYYRAYAREGGRTLLGKVKKFGMEREIINMYTSVRWSSINMGAITAEDFGDFYAWGELEPKTTFTTGNYQYYQDGKYVEIGDNIAGNPAYDAVTAKWRGCWRMPTKAELDELRAHCNWTAKDSIDEKGNTVKGYLVKNNHTADTDSVLFIPKAGYRDGTSHFNANQNSEMWSGTIYSADRRLAYYQLNNSSGNAWWRYDGFTIRPVFESNIETTDGKYLFIRTDSISYSADHTSTNMYGTTRGLDDVVTDLTQGFVIGTGSDVTLESGDALKVTLTKTAEDNGSYHLPLTKEQMNELEFTTKYYVRSYLTYGGNTWYGDPLEMLAMTIATDSTNWQVGKTTARLCGTVTGITESARSSVELGFVVGTTADVTHDTEGKIEIVCDSTVNNKFVCDFNNIENKQYFYRAFVRQGGRTSYGEPKMLGLEFVDLGLPSKTRWANINIGSQTPMDNGSYYSWGEIATKTNYNTGTYDWNENKGTDIAGTLFDAAQVNWRGPWRMPTKADAEELYDSRYCTWELTTLYDKNVYKVTSKINGNYIYLPCAGYMEGTVNYNQNNTRIVYWTSTLDGTITGDGSKASAWTMDNYGNRLYTPFNQDRWWGFSVRPVALVNDTLVDKTMIQLSTDSVQWEVGQTTAKVYGYQMGLRYHEDAAREVGFVWTTTTNLHAITDGATALPEDVTKYFIPVQSEVGRVQNGVLTTTIEGITDGTVYYYRAYALVNGKFYFGEEREFGRKMVNLGLTSGLRWANINLGASSPDDGGDYYAWGETTTKSNYTTTTYTRADYGTDISGSNHDAAHVNWGGIWRMPTKDDLQELLTKCTWTEVTKYGHPMYKVVGPSGDSIFIAKRGYKTETTVKEDGTRAATWTSILSDKQNTSNDKAFGGSFYGTSRNIDAIGRHIGYTVRPVAKWNQTADDKNFYISTDSTDWYVGNAEPRLCGSVYAPADLTIAARGFIVGYKTKIDVVAPNHADAEVTDITGENITIGTDDSNIFRGTYTYAKDTTYYYRAYVKVGDDYYYGEPRRFGLEIVDLGFGVKWASLNVGAQISSDFGNRYAWGETSANKSNYTINSYEYYSNGYQDLTADISNKSYDAAKAAWTGSNKWRMPTQAEMNALLDKNNCDWTWTTIDGVAGYQVTSKVEGYTDKSIFLPANGYQDGSFYRNIGEECFYWSSTHYDGGNSWYLHGSSATEEVVNSPLERFYGFAIRPVSTAGNNQGGGGDITGGHKPGGSTQTGGSGSGTGGHEGGDINDPIGN